MATRVSPAANLLRKSKLFSLPPHIPGPARPLSAEPLAYSETATKIYPTQQAIVTPASSAARGDWGLKRPLPAKSTVDRSSSPIVRINNLDTLEHITDFDSAADHTRTLQKYHELEIPLSLPPDRKTNSKNIREHKSVFEDDAAVAAQLNRALQTSHLESQSQSELKSLLEDSEFLAPARYRYKGPWIAGLSEAEFQEYLKVVKRKKHAFLSFLRQRYNRSRNTEGQQKQADQNGVLEKIKEEPFDEEAFQGWLRKVRQSRGELAQAMREFLDLAPPMSPPLRHHLAQKWDTGPANIATAAYALTGPPKTHPSAGLSYLRTNARLFNHPSYGPQEHRPPVETRLLKSARSGSSTSRGATGVAGFIAADSNIRHADASLQSPDVPGGLRVLTRVTRAVVNPQGSIHLDAMSYSQAQEYSGPPRDYVRGRNRYLGPLTSMKPTANRVTRPVGNSNERYAYESLTRRG